MATLQKIRSHGPLLVIVIGLALFAFIAGDAWKAIQPHTAPNAGKVDGTKLSIQEYQDMVNEYTEAAKLLQGMTTLTEEQTNYFRDLAWNNFVSNQLIEKEAEKLGLKVTDAELRSIIDEGVDPMLQQTPFVNPKTGMFDKDQMTMFLSQYASMDKAQMPQQYHDIYNVWMFIEKQLRMSKLREKYETLLAQAMLSNPTEAKEAFEYRVNQTDALLAAVPYAAVSDSAVKVSDADLKAAYDKKKEQFKQLIETRKVKYIDLPIVASEKDKAEVEKEVKQAEADLANATKDYASLVRSTESVVPFSELYVSKNSLPNDVASRIDEAQMGQAVTTYYNPLDNSYNTFKVLGKTVLPDSVKFEQMMVMAKTPEETKKLTDSIYTALNGGADFAEMAKKFNQTLQPATLTSAQYEGAQLDSDNANFIKTLVNAPAGKYTVTNFPQGNIIFKVLSRSNMIDKYQVAVVKRPVDFSKETYNDTYNKFSQFVAENNSLEKFSKNAEAAGYKLLEVAALASSAHNIGGVPGTHEALKWAFDAKPGSVSVIYDCANGGHLMAVALESVAPKGYVPFDMVKEGLRAEVLRDKKAEKILNDLNAKKLSSFEAYAAYPGAVSDTIKRVSFAADAYVPALSASEPMVSAYAYATEKGKLTAPFKGNAGVYVLQPYAKDKLNETFNAEEIEQGIAGMRMRMIAAYMSVLYKNAEIEDNRYLFFQ